MNKSYVIAEIANSLSKTSQAQLERTLKDFEIKACNTAAKNMFDDLETIFKIYLGENNEDLDVLIEANKALSDSLDYAQKSCIDYEQQIKKLKENKSSVQKQFIEKHNEAVAYYREVVKALIDKV